LAFGQQRGNDRRMLVKVCFWTFTLLAHLVSLHIFLTVEQERLFT